jgi:hypothetical protein
VLQCSAPGQQRERGNIETKRKGPRTIPQRRPDEWVRGLARLAQGSASLKV